jgi:hypothetical protein
MTYTLIHTHTLSRTHTHTYTHILSYAYTHTYTLACARTHTLIPYAHTYPLSHARAHIYYHHRGGCFLRTVEECVLLLQNVFSYCRMCSLTSMIGAGVSCVPLKNVFSFCRMCSLTYTIITGAAGAGVSCVPRRHFRKGGKEKVRTQGPPRLLLVKQVKR